MMRYLASAALPPGQAINEELIANIAPMLDQVGSVLGEVRGAFMRWHQPLTSEATLLPRRPSIALPHASPISLQAVHWVLAVCCSCLLLPPSVTCCPAQVSTDFWSISVTKHVMNL